MFGVGVGGRQDRQASKGGEIWGRSQAGVTGPSCLDSQLRAGSQPHPRLSVALGLLSNEKAPAHSEAGRAQRRVVIFIPEARRG